MIATKPVDFRKGHDGLAALVKNELRKEPFTGTVFVFRARRPDRLKLLYWDGTGLVLLLLRPLLGDWPRALLGTTAMLLMSVVLRW